MNLLRRGEAESSVVDLQIASSRRQTHARSRRARQVLPVNLVIRDNLLNVNWRRGLVGSKMARIDDLYAFSGHEPDSAIVGLRNTRTVRAGRSLAEPDAVSRVPHRGCNSPLRVGDPRVQLASPIRTRPQLVYNHKERSSSSIDQ